VLATVAINLITCIALLLALQSRLQVLPLRDWAMDGMSLLVSAGLSGAAAWALSALIAWPHDLVGRLLQVGLSTAASCLVFFALGRAFDVPEVAQITSAFTRRFSRR